MLKTVRVANPNAPESYMLINAVEYREMVHGPLWPEQEEGFDGHLPPPVPAGQYTPAELELAAKLGIESVEAECLMRGQPAYGSLPLTDRMTMLRDRREVVQRGVAEYSHMRRERLLREREEVRTAHFPSVPPAIEVQVPEGVVPGETPGWPIDSVTGKPLALSPEERAKLAAAPKPENGPATEAQVAVVAAAPVAVDIPPQAPLQAPQPSAIAAPRPEAPSAGPSWATGAAQTAASSAPTTQAPPPTDTTVQPGPGGKFYVMRDGAPVGKGHATQAAAEAAQAKLAKAD